MNDATTKLLLGVVLPAVAAAFGFIPFLLFKSELPNPLASHFGASGVPDGSMSPLAFMGVTGVLFAAGAALCFGATMKTWSWGPGVGVGVASLGAFLCVFASGLLLAVTVNQRGLEDWTEASFSWSLTLAAVLAAIVGAALAARLALRLPAMQLQPPDPSDQPVLALGASEQAVWSTRLQSGFLSALGAIAVIAGGCLGVVLGQWSPALVTLVAGLAVLAIASLKVRVDRSGLHVQYGILPWPRTHIAIEDVIAASVIDVRPMEWGGWGYRGSLKVMKQAAAVLRAGSGIRVDLADGKRFVVTVDDPAVGAGLLNAHVRRTAVEV